jgi:hypothetical protein
MSVNPNPISTAGFRSDPFDYSELYASETVSQSAEIAGGLGFLKRGTVLFGPLAGTPITGAVALTTAPGALAARCILAADIDTSSGEIMGLVYTQGKFLDTGLIFSSAGAAKDVAQLWTFGIYVLSVMNRAGLLLPMINLPATGGPLPQAALSPEDAKEAIEREIAAIKAAGPLPQPRGPESMPRYRHHPNQQPAWAEVAFENAVHEEPLPVDPRDPRYRPPVYPGGAPPLHGSTDPNYGQPAPGHPDHGKHPEAHDVSKHSDHEPKHVDQPKDKK